MRKYYKKKNGVSFHEFPSNNTLRARWISEIRKNEGFKKEFADGDELLKTNCVCSEHLTGQSYRMHGCASLRLKNDATPDNWKKTRKFVVLFRLVFNLYLPQRSSLINMLLNNKCNVENYETRNTKLSLLLLYE